MTPWYDIFDQRGTLARDLFTSLANNKCSTYCTRGVLVTTLRVMLLYSSGQTRSTTPSFFSRSYHEYSTRSDETVILITVCWSRKFWFPSLLCMSACPPIPIPAFPDLLIQHNGNIRYPNPTSTSPHNMVFGWASFLEWPC